MSDSQILELTSEGSVVTVLPQRGAVGRFRTCQTGQWVDWLGSDPHTGVGCFPLVPFASRIMQGQFDFFGQRIGLPANFPPEPHAVHGHGWQRSWQVVDASSEQVNLGYTHLPDAWPWHYAVQQTVSLRRRTLDLRLQVTNLSDAPMPVGLGWHPFLGRPAGASLQAAVGGHWQLDEQGAASRCGAVPESLNLHRGVRLEQADLDEVFAGWQGVARLSRMDLEDRCELVIQADPLFSHLVVYGQASGNFVCVEPVSNIPDGFNRMAAGFDDHGVQVLQPGASLSGSMQIRVTGAG